MTAKRRTPAEIARDELRDTEIKLKALKKRLEKARDSVAELEDQVFDLTELRDWQRSNPLLKNTSASPPPAEEPLGVPIVAPADKEPDPKWATEAARDDQAYSAQITQGLTKKETD